MALKLSQRGEEEEDNSTFWLITYSDMTTLLLAFFLLMFSFTLMSQEKQEALLEELNQVAKAKEAPQRREDLEATAREIAKQFAQDATFIDSTEEEVTVGLSSSVTFALGDAELTPEAREPLDKVAAILARLPNPVRVEGHTDDLPMRGGRYPTNWHLSAARAQSVVKLLIAQGVDPRRLQVIGFGETRPRAPNDSDGGRAANRRIELKLVRTGTK
ncbi:MAG: OmpA/MotB family protein [Myxococcaceae bacterium]